MRPTRILSVLVLVTGTMFAFDSDIEAQSVGDRVRVTAAGARIVGQVTDVNNEGLGLLQGEMQHSFDYGEIYRLERSTGLATHWKKGLLFGGGAGALGAVAIGGLVGGGCEIASLGAETQECAEQGFEVALGLGLFWGAIGAGLGAGVGLLMGGESWTSIPLRPSDAGFSPIVAPLPGPEGPEGVLLGARIKF